MSSTEVSEAQYDAVVEIVRGLKCSTCCERFLPEDPDEHECHRCRELTRNLEDRYLACRGKIHHATEESAAEHVAGLGGEAYAYECDACNEWTDAAGDAFDNTGLHWHVASSPTPRKWRE